MPSLISRITLATAVVLTGLSAGFFATYYYSVTRALLTVDDSTYVKTFQAINATVRSPEFAVVFFGSALALLAAIVLHRKSRRVLLLLVGAAIAYAGLLAITIGFHVPLNNELALASTQTTALANEARYFFEIPWNQMHGVRTLCVLVAFGLTTIAALAGQRAR